MAHFHKAAGHPTARNPARVVKHAKMEKWKIKLVLDYQCPTCAALRGGGTSSGEIPPAATHAQFAPWQAVGMDVSEWVIPNNGPRKKLKFLLIQDMATRLRAVVPLMEPYELQTMKTETAEQVIDAFTRAWLGHYPKPEHVVTDNANTMNGEKFSDFCRGVGIDLTSSAEKESWAHGLLEHCMKDIKFTARKLKTLLNEPEHKGF